jgi:hypothetical protein
MTSGDSGSASFTANVKLPVGATITQLRHYHWGNGIATTTVTLYRTKIGAAFDATGADTLMRTSSTASASILLPPQIVSTTAAATPTSDLVVRPGYRYFLVAGCTNSGGLINGVRVYFSP